MLDLNLKGFPPRLPEQPIFYPVLNQAYAEQIALEWNTKDKFSDNVGFVTEFNVASPFIDKYEEQIVGARKHNELWIPAEDIDELNLNIEGHIKLVNVFYGVDYKGLNPDVTIFADKNPTEQFIAWKGLLDGSSVDFNLEVKEQWKYIYMNYSYWKKTGYIDYGITEETKSEVLSAIREYWNEHFPQIDLFEGNG